MIRLSAAILLMFGTAASAGQMRAVTITGDQKWTAPRWMQESQGPVTGPPVVQTLVKIRKAQLEKRYADCAKAARAGKGAASGLKFWLAEVELQCALKFTMADGNKGLPLLSQALIDVEKNPQWLLVGPQVPTLKSLYVEGQLVRFENQTKNQRKLAWSTFDTLMEWSGELDSSQRARAFRGAGELAFVEQNLTLAVDMFSRSLNDQDSPDLRKKLEAILAATKKASVSDLKSLPDSKAGTETKGAAKDAPPAMGDEQEAQLKIKQALDQGELLPAIEEGVKLINNFPGSLSAKWAADRILDVYFSIGAKGDGGYEAVRKKAVSEMAKADGARVYRWANNAFARGFYADALKLAEAAAGKLDGLPDATKAIQLAANSALYCGEMSQAEKWFERLVNQHGGTEESRQALFRLGLIRFRAKKWADTSAFMERLMVAAQGTDWEYPALYWHWRAQQRMKSGGGKESADKLIAKYPLTYYGLRARAEQNGGVLKFEAPKGAPLKSEMWLTESQSQAWERLSLLLKAGWFDEAQAEIQRLPQPASAEDQLVRARLLAAAFDHYGAVKAFNEVWSKRSDLFDWDLARGSFPLEFTATIEREGRESDVDPNLVRGLIRQESTFRADVVSAANAYGLMQVLPATAKEVATLKKFKPALQIPDDLSNPELNIKIGSSYLGRMVRAFKGNLPLGLAAYNAGIGRLRKWLASRPDLGAVEGKMSSAPEDEVWIDELPWDETSTYVKAILRNLLVYETMAKGEYKLPEPVWLTRSP